MDSNGMISKYVVVCVLLLTGISLSSCSDDGESPNDTDGAWLVKISGLRASGEVTNAIDGTVVRFDHSDILYIETDSTWTREGKPHDMVFKWIINGTRNGTDTWNITGGIAVLAEGTYALQYFSCEGGTAVMNWDSQSSKYSIDCTQIRSATDLGTYRIELFQQP